MGNSSRKFLKFDRRHKQIDYYKIDLEFGYVVQGDIAFLLDMRHRGSTVNGPKLPTYVVPFYSFNVVTKKNAKIHKKVWNRTFFYNYSNIFIEFAEHSRSIDFPKKCTNDKKHYGWI